MAYVEIYSFADRLGAPILGDAALEQLDKVNRPERMPGRAHLSAICQAWETTPETSGLCRYLLYMERDANSCGLSLRSDEDYPQLPGSFTANMLRMTTNDRDTKPRLSSRTAAPTFVSCSMYVCCYHSSTRYNMRPIRDLDRP